MSIYELKPKFQQLLRPLVRRLYARGVTANQVTFFACLISVGFGIGFALAPHCARAFILLPLWLFLRMALNAADGMLAREFGQKSRLGGYLNELTDVIADAALYLPFALIAPFDPLVIGCFIFFAALTEFCGVLGQVHGNSRRYDGPLGKSDRAFVIGALALWYALAGQLPAWMLWPMWGLVALLVATCVQRVRLGLRD